MDAALTWFFEVAVNQFHFPPFGLITWTLLYFALKYLWKVDGSLKVINIQIDQLFAKQNEMHAENMANFNRVQPGE